SSALLGRLTLPAVWAFWMAISMLPVCVSSKRWRASRCPPSSTRAMTTFHVFLTASSSAAAASFVAPARVMTFLSASCAHPVPPLSRHPPRAIRSPRCREARRQPPSPVLCPLPRGEGVDEPLLQSLNVSEFGVGWSWCMCVRVRLHAALLLSQDWFENGEEMHSASASVDTLQTAYISVCVERAARSASARWVRASRTVRVRGRHPMLQERLCQQ